jgi:hypothetical protein
VFGDFDSLAWDLGNPDEELLDNPGPLMGTASGTATSETLIPIRPIRLARLDRRGREAAPRLNVSVAAAVCLFEAVRQRHTGIGVEGNAGAPTRARRGAPGML